MEIMDVARQPRVNASPAAADPPTPAAATFGLVLLHIAFFAVGSVLLLAGFAAAAAQRLASALRGRATPVAVATYAATGSDDGRPRKATTPPTTSTSAASALTP